MYFTIAGNAHKHELCMAFFPSPSPQHTHAGVLQTHTQIYTEAPPAAWPPEYEREPALFSNNRAIDVGGGQFSVAKTAENVVMTGHPLSHPEEARALACLPGELRCHFLKPLVGRNPQQATSSRS